MQRVDGVLRKILFILLGLISIYWLYWSVRYMFTDVFPIMSRALFLSVITVLIIINYLFFIGIKGQKIIDFYRTTYESIKYLLSITIGGVVLINTISFFRNWRQSAINEEFLKSATNEVSSDLK